MPDKKWTYPPGPNGGNGQSITWHEDGSVTVKDEDGTETHYDPKTGAKTKTAPPPAATEGGVREVKPDGEIRIGYAGRRVRFYPGPPPRFKIIRTGGGTPREEEFNSGTGVRGVTPQEGGQKTETPPTTEKPEEITPSTHPKPAETPAPAPAPTPAPAPSGGSKDDKKKPKKKVKARRGKARPKKKPARKAKKKPARRKTSRR